MRLFYSSDGFLTAVNADDGSTLAVFQSGQIHPDYDNDKTIEAIGDVLLFDPSKVAPPEPSEDEFLT